MESTTSKLNSFAAPFQPFFPSSTPHQSHFDPSVLSTPPRTSLKPKPSLESESPLSKSTQSPFSSFNFSPFSHSTHLTSPSTPTSPSFNRAVGSPPRRSLNSIWSNGSPRRSSVNSRQTKTNLGGGFQFGGGHGSFEIEEEQFEVNSLGLTGLGPLPSFSQISLDSPTHPPPTSHFESNIDISLTYSTSHIPTFDFNHIDSVYDLEPDLGGFGEPVGGKVGKVPEATESTRYLLVCDIDPLSTAEDLWSEILQFHPTLKGIFTPLLQSQGKLILVFWDVRDAEESRRKLLNGTGREGGWLARCWFVERKEIVKHSPPGPNPLLSLSESTLFISLRFPSRHPSPLASLHSNVNSTSPLSSPLQLLSHLPLSISENDIRRSKSIENEPESILVEFWDERVSDKFETEVERISKGNKEGMGMGLGFAGDCKVEWSREPDLESSFWNSKKRASPVPLDELTSLSISHNATTFVPVDPIPNLTQIDSPTPPSLKPLTPISRLSTPFVPATPVNSNEVWKVEPTVTFPEPESSRWKKINGSGKENGGEGGGKMEEKWGKGREGGKKNFEQASGESQETPPTTLLFDNPKPFGLYRDDKIPSSNVINLSSIVSGTDTRTTLMLRNIPTRATTEQVIEFVDEALKECGRGGRRFDFVYLRADFTSLNNVGYAFLNFLTPMDLHDFFKVKFGTRWNLCRSNKLVIASYANIQGRFECISHFRSSAVMTQRQAFRPQLFYTSGPLAGQPEPFPKSNDPERQARSTANLSSVGLFPASAPVFKVAQAVQGGLHI